MPNVKNESTPAFLKCTLETLDRLDTEAVAVGISTDLKPPLGVLGLLDWRLCGSISQLIRQGTITGQDDESILISTYGRIKAPCVFLFGWGEKKTFNDSYQSNLHRMFSSLKKAKIKTCALAMPIDYEDAIKLAPVIMQKTYPFELTGIFEPKAKLRNP